MPSISSTIQYTDKIMELSNYSTTRGVIEQRLNEQTENNFPLNELAGGDTLSAHKNPSGLEDKDHKVIEPTRSPCGQRGIPVGLTVTCGLN